VADHPEPEPADDSELVLRARTGDESAFGTLMRRHHAPIFRRVLAIVRDEPTAREVCQDVWLTVWKQLPGFRGEARFTTWLFPIATRRAIDHLRSRRRWFTRFLPFRHETGDAEGDERFAAAPEPAGPDDPRGNLERRESQDRFERAIAALPPKHRAVLALREIEGLSYEEIAAQLAIAPGTVMSRLFHARRQLAQKLADLP
jgi:RNA polymerase sigma-70 factor (ECF subfamily)